MVTPTLDPHFRGASLRKVTQHIAQFYGVKMNESTVLRWIRKFSQLIDDYSNTLKPQLSGVWNCDEMKTKMAHEQPLDETWEAVAKYESVEKDRTTQKSVRT